MSAPTWPEEVGRELVEAGVPWLSASYIRTPASNGRIIEGADDYVIWLGDGSVEGDIGGTHSVYHPPADSHWMDLRDGGSIGAVWLWLEQRAGYTVGVHPGLTHHCRHYCYVGDLDADDVPRGEGDTPEEARARGFLALAREVLS